MLALHLLSFHWRVDATQHWLLIGSEETCLPNGLILSKFSLWNAPESRVKAVLQGNVVSCIAAILLPSSRALHTARVFHQNL
jgi:hypothetical protein